jgi:hypothetical protein
MSWIDSIQARLRRIGTIEKGDTDLANGIKRVINDNQHQTEEDTELLMQLVKEISSRIGGPVVFHSESKETFIHPDLLKELKKPGNEGLLEIAKYW